MYIKKIKISYIFVRRNTNSIHIKMKIMSYIQNLKEKNVKKNIKKNIIKI